MFRKLTLLLLLALLVVAVFAQESIHQHEHPIDAETSAEIAPEWDIVQAQVSRFGSKLIFQLVLAGEAGLTMPEAVGDLANASVYSYVWPTTLNSSTVGFEADAGILALAVTSHPDFDDTPLWDENEDGDLANDGQAWHAHWVVLVEDAACGAGLKVRDIEEDASPLVPATWPELPLYIDSPDYDLELWANEVVVEVPYAAIAETESFNFDGVTAGLRVDADLHNPLLCVEEVNNIASGDLSMTGEAR